MSDTTLTELERKHKDIHQAVKDLLEQNYDAGYVFRTVAKKFYMKNPTTVYKIFNEQKKKNKREREALEVQEIENNKQPN